MEPEKWFIDTEGSRNEHAAENDWEEEGQRETQRLLEGAALGSPTTDHQQGAESATRASSGQGGEASSHNSVDDLLRRIARDVSARQARTESSTSSRRDRDHESNKRNSSSSSSSSHQVTNSDADRSSNSRQRWQHDQQPRQPSQDPSLRRSRWGSTSRDHNRSSSTGELGASARRANGDGREREGGEREKVPAVSVAEANPFTESMWDDASCRQVLQAMYFATDSAVPAGSTEEYKELEGETTTPDVVGTGNVFRQHHTMWVGKQVNVVRGATTPRVPILTGRSFASAPR